VTTRRRNPAVWLLDRALALYQKVSGLGSPRCRYLPTCSEYAREAVLTHGAGRGSWLALRRVGRCHPWGGHGYDPVPPPGRRHGLADAKPPLTGAGS
jgi:hypothetical protein